MVIFSFCHDQKFLPIPGSIGLHMARNSNPKYISLIKGETIAVKRVIIDIDYVTLYIPMGSAQIN